jgi:hypothetical protein
MSAKSIQSPVQYSRISQIAVVEELLGQAQWLFTARKFQLDSGMMERTSTTPEKMPLNVQLNGWPVLKPALPLEVRVTRLLAWVSFFLYAWLAYAVGLDQNQAIWSLKKGGLVFCIFAVRLFSFLLSLQTAGVW